MMFDLIVALHVSLGRLIFSACKTYDQNQEHDVHGWYDMMLEAWCFNFSCLIVLFLSLINV